MFSSTGDPLYRTIMSERRFQFLLRCLRFDDLNTRSQRKHTDEFAPIRNIWNQFIEACKSYYEPGATQTVDEQLLSFRGVHP